MKFVSGWNVVLVLVPVALISLGCSEKRSAEKPVAETPTVSVAGETTTNVDPTVDNSELNSALTQVESFKTPGLECELSGIYPSPTDPDCYYVVANKKPPYRYGQQPMLPGEIPRPIVAG